MKKIEIIWHHILVKALEEKQYKHTQQAIARELGCSLSTVNHALDKPSSIGAIRKSGKFFVLADFWKLTMYWATYRSLKKDIIYEASVDLSVSQIEGLVPSKATFACYSAARVHLVEPPADYAKVYIYDELAGLEEIKRRFPPGRKRLVREHNFFVLMGGLLPRKGSKITSLPLTFVDIWNLPDWYSNDFTLALKEKIDGVLS